MFLLQAAVLQSNNSNAGSIVSAIFESQFLYRVYSDLKIITIIYSVILFIAIIMVVINAKPKKIIKELIEGNLEGVLSKEKEPEEKNERWNKILKLLEGAEESSWRQAVMDADKFFDDIMNKLGYSGETFSDRLKQVHATEVQNLDALWNAHRVRNSISHDVDFILSQDDARRAVGAYEQAMKDMDVM